MRDRSLDFDARVYMDCPKCGAVIPEFCKTPKFKKTDIHKERIADWMRSSKYALEKRFGHIVKSVFVNPRWSGQ